MADDISIKPVDAAWAFLIKNEDGQEAVVSMVTRRGMIPLICFEEEAFPRMREVAKEMVEESGKSITVVKFTNREDVETLEPDRVKPASLFPDVPIIGE